MTETEAEAIIATERIGISEETASFERIATTTIATIVEIGANLNTEIIQTTIDRIEEAVRMFEGLTRMNSIVTRTEEANRAETMVAIATSRIRTKPRITSARCSEILSSTSPITERARITREKAALASASPKPSIWAKTRK